jgi:hypothetical protein
MKISLYIAVSFLIVCLFNRPALLIPPEVQGFFFCILTNQLTIQPTYTIVEI